ncbi:MAG: cytidylyltransferase domain-containing protein [Phycisphaerales bacterium JB040]
MTPPPPPGESTRVALGGERGRVVALVPMRHGSERVPGKNHRVLAGKRACCWVIDALLESGVIDEVLIDTDSAPIREIGEMYAGREGASVRVIDRPAHLAGGHVSMNDVIRHDLGHTDAEVVVQTHATNPMLRPETIASCVRAYRERASTNDSLFTVTRHQARFYTPEGDPLNHDPAELRRTQDLRPMYEENSCLYVFSPGSFRAAGARIGERPVMVELDPIEAVDLDEERDFALAEAIARSGLVRGAMPARVIEESAWTEPGRREERVA